MSEDKPIPPEAPAAEPVSKAPEAPAAAPATPPAALEPKPVSTSTRSGRSHTSVMRRTSVSTSSRLEMPRSGSPSDPAATPPPER